MKRTVSLISIVLGAIVVFALSSMEPAQPIIGTWKMVSYQYESKNSPVVDLKTTKDVAYKTFTGTRFSTGSYSIIDKKFIGACGGTYTLKGDQYAENIEYYSWDAGTVGKTITFQLTIENGKLHQKGFMEWKGNKEYLIDEWYEKVE